MKLPGPADHVAPPLGAPVFELGVDEAVVPGLVRITVSLVDRTRVVLGEPSLDLDIRVHEARKSMKKTRALLRMLRPHIGDDAFRRESDAVRDAGRVLSEARDAAVLVLTLDEVAADVAGVGELREPLAELARERRGAVTAEVVRGILQDLDAVEVRIGSLATGGTGPANGFGAVAPGIRRVYRRGRRRMDIAIAEGSADAYHDWRKPAKNLFYALEVLQRAWSEEAENMVTAAKVLAEVLGAEHDLAVLDHVVDERELGTRDARRQLAAVVEARRLSIQGTARTLGSSLYQRKPSEFVGHLGDLWQVWRADGPKMG